MKSEYPSIEFPELLLKLPSWKEVIPHPKRPGFWVDGVHELGIGLAPARLTWIKLDINMVSDPKGFDAINWTSNEPEDM